MTSEIIHFKNPRSLAGLATKPPAVFLPDPKAAERFLTGSWGTLRCSFGLSEDGQAAGLRSDTPIGIDVHDPMDYTKPLNKGMVFTIEPGVYIPEEKIGVRIEDIFYVDSDGRLVDLVTQLPREAADVEAAMRR